MNDEFSKYIDKFSLLSDKIAKGKDSVDYCVKDGDFDWIITPLENDILEVLKYLTAELSVKPELLDSASLTKALISIDKCDRARDSFRADPGIGYIDINSPLYDPVWDFRYILKDSVESLRKRGTDIIAGADKSVLYANNGYWLIFFNADISNQRKVKFFFILDKCSELAEKIKDIKFAFDTSGGKIISLKGERYEPTQLEKDIASCLRDISLMMDWDVFQDNRRPFYSDDDYTSTRYNYDDTPNTNNLLWFFTADSFNRLIKIALDCAPAIFTYKYKNSYTSDSVLKESVKKLIEDLKYLLSELKKVNINLLDGVSKEMLTNKNNGFKKTFYKYFTENRSGEFV